MVKGSFSEKCKFLFKMYDIDKTGGVSYNQFLKMVNFIYNTALQLP